MRLTTSSKGLLLGGALALMAAGCSDDDKKASDGGTDAGRDSGGPIDSGVDSHVSLPPVHLRLAHLAFGTGVGPVHICAYDSTAPSGQQYSLVTTDALSTGNFLQPTVAVPVTYGAITKHVDLPELVLAQLAGKQIQIYKAAEAGTAIVVVNATTSLATCTPTGTAIATASIGTESGQVNLIPGHAHTIVVAGASGAEITADPSCVGAGGCAPPAIYSFEDEVTTTATTEAHVRVLLTDQRFGATPGFCHNLFGAAPMNILPVRDGASVGLVNFIAAGASTYEDVTPVLPGAGPTPQLLTLHINAGTATPPCGVSSGLPGGFNGITSAGAIPNAILIGQYQAQAAAGRPVATLRSSLAAGEVTTVFIAPFLTQFGDATDGFAACAAGSSMTCVPVGVDATAPGTPCALGSSATCAPKGIDTANSNAVCGVGSSATCLQAGIDVANSNAACVSGTTASCLTCAPSTSCIWLDTAIPAADTLPVAP